VVRSTSLVQVETDEGVTGLGETIGGYFCPEAVVPLVDFYRERMLGMDPLQPDTIWRELYQQSSWWGRVGFPVMVLSGIDIALWDLAGKAYGKPVWQLLGGSAHDRVRLYASGTQATWPVERAVEHAGFYVDRGFRALKLATGYFGHPRGTWHAHTASERAAEERAKFGALRRAVGDGVDLVIDGHVTQVRDHWSRKTPILIAKAIEEFEIAFFEEPLRYDDPAGYAEVRAATRIPIAGGECLTGVEEFGHFLDAGALDYVQPDCTVSGGIGETIRAVRMAADRHVGLIVHNGAAVGPGLMANVHLAFASPSCRYLEYVLALKDLSEEFLLEPLVLRDGCIVGPPTAPGLGVELRPDLLDRHPFRHGAVEFC